MARPWVDYASRHKADGWQRQAELLAQVSFLHAGRRLCYFVPPTAMERMEALLGASFPQLLALCSNFPQHAVALLSPQVLRTNNIPLCWAEQRAGEFLLLFPGSYYASVSLETTCAETVRVATPSWIKVRLAGGRAGRGGRRCGEMAAAECQPPSLPPQVLSRAPIPLGCRDVPWWDETVALSNLELSQAANSVPKVRAG